MEYQWLLGCLMCAIGSFFSSFGLVLQKHAFNVAEGETRWWLLWRWWLGWFMAVCVAGLMESVALVLAPLSLIAPMFGLSVAANSVVSACALGETMNWTGVIALFVIVVGTSLTSALGPHSNSTYTDDQLVQTLTDWNAAMYFMTMTAVCCLSMLALSFPTPKWLESLLYANLAGCTGGNQTLFLKCTMITITNMVKLPATGTATEEQSMLQWDAVQQTTPFVMVGMTTLLGLGQLFSLNEGLAKHSAITYLAAYKSILTVYGCIAGGICFKEFYSLQAWQLLSFPVAVLIVIVGLLALTRSEETAQEMSNDNGDGSLKSATEADGLLANHHSNHVPGHPAH